MNIYHKPHSNCVGQSLLVCFLRKHFSQANFIAESYTVPAELLDNYVNTQQLIVALENDQHLPDAPKQNCLAVLNNCPAYLKVALHTNRISFDIVIISDEGNFYWEFHENQHRNLSVVRGSNVYNAETKEIITVPRYVQRLVRDVWRFQNFENYTIVWQDWFVANCYDYQPQLQPGLKEFSLPNKFSFSDFYNHSER